jgi:hypothetical protein
MPDELPCVSNLREDSCECIHYVVDHDNFLPFVAPPGEK